MPAMTRKIFDAFLAIDLPAGVHTIEFSYFPQGLAPGAAITAGAALILLILILIRILMIRKRQVDRSQKEAMRRLFV